MDATRSLDAAGAAWLGGDDCLSLREGRLFIEQRDVVELEREFGTPLYAISEGQLRANASGWQQAFERHWPQGPVRVLPSIKANLSLALRRILNQEGLGCDVFGPGELEAALRCEVPAELISLNGSAKDPDTIRRAVEAGVKITLDSLAELEYTIDAARRLGRSARVRPRLRPWLRGVQAPSDFFDGPGTIQDLTQVYKPGLPVADALECARAALAADEVELTGVHAHIGRHTTDLAVWRRYVEAVVELIVALREATGGWTPAEVDLGGGLAIPRDPTGRATERRSGAPAAPSFDAYAEALAGTLAAALQGAGIEPAGIALEVEPGRATYGNAGIHLATVRHVKRQAEPVERRWVEVDTTEQFLLDGALEHCAWTAMNAGRAAERVDLVADITGISCGWDQIVADAALPAATAAGDVLAFLDTGAYEESLATNFNALPRPATVLVSGAEADLIKRRETVAEVFARDVVPERLGGGA